MSADPPSSVPPSDSPPPAAAAPKAAEGPSLTSGKGATAEAYVRALLDLLGDRDPFEVHEALVKEVRKAVGGLRMEVLRQKEAPGKWSILEVIQHLVDTEWIYGYRYRLILAHDEPPIPGYDPDLWTERLHNNEVELVDALERLRLLHGWNLELLRSLSDEEWDRVGLHSERGPESIRKTFRLIAAHDIVHLRQIERIKRAIGAV